MQKKTYCFSILFGIRDNYLFLFIFLVFNEASPNKQRTKVVIEQNNALIAFSDKKRVDYESIDIVQEARTSKTKKEWNGIFIILYRRST